MNKNITLTYMIKIPIDSIILKIQFVNNEIVNEIRYCVY